jgi:nitrite reductase/ring-hydroxylating ferredoxin subunit
MVAGMLLLWAGCSSDYSDQGIAQVTFPDKVLNLSLPEYQDLNTKGFKYIGGGVRGIIIVKVQELQYHAYERNCTFRPEEPSATVEVHSSLLYMEDPVCGSQFRLSDGEPTRAPASRPLRQYRTTYDGMYLTITDEIAN